ncbi:MAG: Trk system potassium transporter TrkA [Firmicutes bacterium]|nr:Trk system potassium transporter TrkA [Bacillota bacterium]
MKIIVVGCGKIGTTIVGTLNQEGHDVTAIDISESVLQNISDLYDVQTLVGNGADYDTLIEAGVEDCRLFLAVTPSDETNILCCFLARRMGAHHTVARTESMDTNGRELQFIKQQMNISMFLNPSQLVAAEFLNMLNLPTGVRADYFARRSFEMIEFKLRDEWELDGLTLIEMRKRYKGKYLVVAVGRGEEAYVPDGFFRLRSGDRITLNASPAEATRLLSELGYREISSHNVMILGGSKTAQHLSNMLLDIGSNVKIIEENRERCRQLCELVPDAAIICGDGARGELLNEEGLGSMDAFVALTGMDEENILMAIYAGSQNVNKTLAKVDRSEFADLAAKLGLDGQVEPKRLVSDLVVRYARAIENAVGNNVETLYKLMNGKVEALEFNVRSGFKQNGVALRNLNGTLKSNILIGGIVRGNERIIPGPNDSMKVGDRVIVVSSGHTLYDLSDIFIKER